ncbi:MAG: glutaminyl-peptide cyclotransferase [Hyphomonadaceae bacterium]|nr:glutaminyl-peptide cyclotransferase [Hyphomonadaceae bacterium]
MRTLLTAIFIAAASCSPAPAPAPSVAAAPAVPVYSHQVVATYPHDKAAFTEGLQFVDGVMYESTGMEGTSWIRRFDLATGAVQAQHDIDDQYFGEGVLVLPDKIISLTWKNQKGFIYDRATLKPTGEFAYEGEGWALTTDGQKIFMSDGTSRIRILDPATLQETGGIDVKMNGRPVDQLNELEFIKGEIWANVFQSDRIVRIDPATGNVNSVVYLANLLSPQDRQGADVLNGIAYDSAGDRIFVTGKYWPKLFEIKLKDPAAPKPN